MNRWLLPLIAAAALLTGCAHTDNTQLQITHPLVSPQNIPLDPSGTVENLPSIQVSHYSRGYDYHTVNPEWYKVMLGASWNQCFPFPDYSKAYTFTFTLPYNWTDGESTAKNGDGTVALYKFPVLMHIPEGSWPTDMEALRASVTANGGELAELDHAIGIRETTNGWEYYLRMDETTVAQILILDSNEQPDFTLHQALLQSFTVTPAMIRLYDQQDVIVYQRSCEALEIVYRGEHSCTIEGYLTDMGYEVWGYGDGQIIITVFGHDEQYFLLVDPESSRIEEVHAPDPLEVLRLAGYDIQEEEVLSQYSNFYQYDSDTKRITSYVTTKDYRYSIRHRDGETAISASKLTLDAQPDEEAIRSSFDGMIAMLRLGSDLVVDYMHQMEFIDGTVYYQNYNYVRTWDSFAHTCRSRLTAECADALLNSVNTNGSRVFLQREDGLLLYSSTPSIARGGLLFFDTDSAIIMPLENGGCSFLVPRTIDRNTEPDSWHYFELLYEDGCWRWQFDIHDSTVNNAG